MRLINTESLELEEFFDSNQPSYAILSHTWDAGEVSFTEWNIFLEDRNSKKALQIQKKQGFQKILDFCRVVKQGHVFCHHGVCSDIVDRMDCRPSHQCRCCLATCRCPSKSFNWAWCDTISIDKSSSAELSEAINSMYNWYQGAEICYAFLGDVSDQDKIYEKSSEFRQSRWFTRGWTLQELIAPKAVQFFSKSWKHIDGKHHHAELIEEITGIPKGLMFSPTFLASFSIAQRMSWAALRTTTRKEDLAYCLLGIFGVHMPLLYGEGNRAFIRLQEEIIKRVPEHSIFAWNKIETHANTEFQAFADSPSRFKSCSNINSSLPLDIINILPEEAMFRRPFQITNVGLHITIPLISFSDLNIPSHWCADNGYLAILSCEDSLRPQSLIALRLEHYPENNMYVRIGETVFLDLKGVGRKRLSRWLQGEVLKEIYLEC
jgi:hypothetical protein